MKSFKNKGDREKENSKLPTDYKAKLEGKLYIARETPEPVFDLSSCDLKHVPNDIYTLFKNFKKEALYLQNNRLTNLDDGGLLGDLQTAKILNISNNKFSKLPHDMGVFENLEVLDASKNHLQEVPETIGSLKYLVRLNLSNNNLHSLPDSIGNCKNLEVLDLTFNKPLKKLPKTLGKLTSLMILNFDKSVKYPPKEVYEKGVAATLKFLLKELHEIPSTSKNKKMQEDSYTRLKEQIEVNEKLKMEKQRQLLEIEKKISADREREFELQEKKARNKNKLLQEVKIQEDAIASELNKFQEKKNAEHTELLKACLEEEKKSALTIYKMLHNNTKLKKKLAESWEKSKKEEAEWLKTQSSKTNETERKKILSSMNDVMREEIQKAQKLAAEKHSYAVQSLANEISFQNASLQKLISKFDQTHTQFVETLIKNQELQKSAVASLLERSDAISWNLNKQVAIIEAELAELTRIELFKRRLETDYQIAELNKNRIALTEMLMQLFKIQAERRKQLINRLKKMESMKNSETYWMEQYSKLLNSKSHQTVQFLEAVDQRLAYEMFLMGVFHYLPLLSNVALSEEKLMKLDGKALSKLGIDNLNDRDLILTAIENYIKAKQVRFQPSAPMLTPSATSKASRPSITPNSVQSSISRVNQLFLSSTPSSVITMNRSKEKNSMYSVPDECVICLEKRPKVIFVPCGHVCCCYKCYKTLSKCPLCRKQIVAVHEYNGWCRRSLNKFHYYRLK